MSLPLKDLRVKVKAQTHCLITAEARARGIDTFELVREILDGYADTRLHALIEATKLLRVEGLDGALRGAAAHRPST